MKRTNRTLLLAVGAGLAVGNAYGQAVVYEPFDYPVGNLNGAGGTTEVGLDGTWAANGDSKVSANLQLYGALAQSGGSVDDLNGSVNRFGGARTITSGALTGLLGDGDTLWFSAIMGYDGGNATNTTLALAFANNQFSGSNFDYAINDEGPQKGTGLGVIMGRDGSTNGTLRAAQYRSSADFGNGFASVVYGDNQNGGPATFGSILGATEYTLVVGKITWAANPLDPDTIELYNPDNTLTLGDVISTLSVVVDQSTFDTITWSRGDKVTLDEIRFGATSGDVLPVVSTAPTVASIEDNQGGGPIGEDVAVVTYTVTFDQVIDAGTVDATDFAITGDVTSSLGTVTQVAPNVFEVQSLPTSAPGTLGFEIPTTATIDNLVAIPLDVTVAIPGPDLTVETGSSPDTGIRYWDGTITSGVTDGVSQGGTATWDNGTTTNWDPGAGFANPVAWDNSLISDAVIGGSGTATLAEDIIAGDISTVAGATVALDGNNLDATALSGSGGAISNGSATTASTLTVNQSSNTTYSGSIDDGAAATTKLVKSGSGDLALRGSSSFTGGLEIAGGRITVTNSGSEQSFLGGASNVVTFTANGELYNTNGAVTLPQGITINGGVTGRVTGAFGERTEVDGVLAGSGTLVVQGYSAGYNAEFRNTANTFTGPIEIRSGDGVIAEFTSLADSPGATTIGLQSNSNVGGQFHYRGGAITPLLLNNRQFELIVNGNSGTNSGRQAKIVNNASGANTVTINQDLLITGTGTKKLYLGGGNSGDNTFAGDIPDGVAGAAFTLYKESGGKWVLSGANTYTGGTVMSGGTLTVDGSLADSSMTVSSGTVEGSGTLTFGPTDQIDISGGTVDLSGFTVVGAGLTDPVYIIVDSVDGGSYTGTFAVENVPGYTVNYDYDGFGTQVALEAAGGSPFDTWAGTGTMGAVTFEGDTNGDGVQDGMAFLLGAANPDDDANGRLPAVTEDGSGNLVMQFNCLADVDRGTAELRVAHSNALTSWTATVDEVPDSTDPTPDNNVTFVVGAGPVGPPATNSVTATIDSAAAGGGKLFGRLQATE